MSDKETKCCELTDHNPVWAGDGYFCSKCMIRFTFGSNKLPNKEECPHKPVCYNSIWSEYCDKCKPVSPSDKTWEERFDDKFPPVSRWSQRSGDYTETPIPHIKAFIQDLLTSATIKAKEGVLMGLLEVKINGIPSIEQEVHRVLAYKVLDYAKSLGINLTKE